MPRLASRISTFALVALSLVACRSKSDGSSDDGSLQLVTDGNEGAAAGAQSTHLGNLVFSVVASQDPSTAADQSSSGGALWPSGCVAREKDAANPLVVHLHFTDCTGPFGLVHLNGDEDVTFSAGSNGALRADFASQNLTANGKPITHTATADVTVSGSSRDVAWNGSWTAVDDKGQTVSHTSTYDVKVDTTTGCLTTDGTAKTNVAAREVDTTVTGYRLCRNATGNVGCPSGQVVYTGKASGMSVSVDFDGSASAAVTGPGGHTYDVPLVCVP